MDNLFLQDAVARNAKFWVLYKRPGQRVLINVRGDMLVRPSFAELSIQQTPVGSSVYHVRTLSYVTRALVFYIGLRLVAPSIADVPGILVARTLILFAAFITLHDYVRYCLMYV